MLNNSIKLKIEWICPCLFAATVLHIGKIWRGLIWRIWRFDKKKKAKYYRRQKKHILYFANVLSEGLSYIHEAIDKSSPKTFDSPRLQISKPPTFQRLQYCGGCIKTITDEQTGSQTSLSSVWHAHAHNRVDTKHICQDAKFLMTVACPEL